MVVDVTMPQLGESVSEGTIIKWLVHEGDFVEKGQPLLEVATDKADTEVPSPVEGRVLKILRAEKMVVAVKGILCQIEEGASRAESAGSSKTAKDASEVSPQARGKGALHREAPSANESHFSSVSVTGSSLATPTARKAALEHSIPLEQVQGSGDRGRITRDDVVRASEKIGAQASLASFAPLPREVPTSSVEQLSHLIREGGGFVMPVPGVGHGAFKVPPYCSQEGDQVVPFTRRRRITADHMVYSKVVSPHVVTVAEVDLHKTSKIRELNKDRYKKEGLSLTMLAFVIAAVVRALRESPVLNARVLEDSYVLFKDINIGTAMESPAGLVVPVIRRADELGIRGIARSIGELADRARTGKITADDLRGATFSVTNPGLKGNLFGGAIINQPNVGILRMGEIQKRVVVVEGPDGEDQMAIHSVMYLALSYDHRIVDGVAANQFLWAVADFLKKGDFEV
ncbi:dihydrolipoamide acetyltransferase family protein [Pajaroellobacter abortibovis]|uniref:Dihydrolipoamide acetyltransferase component of pyruvate dehydrogenase complex n=1 Tax=Pajaroellobacter abortibovis TaxID=1882918 RepID=A0A1L6MY93_9BACT|nr:dihydrolipoamide acetyltransferase family protein [Pajaroellobacter abortibovis]APS00479.1 dihydrolipoyllysine acetyltransferase [Pajaroellobacter abortibovis]